MRKISYGVGTIILIIALVYGYHNNTKPNSDNNSGYQEAIETSSYSLGLTEKSELVQGMDTVLTSLKELEDTITKFPNDTKKINEKGITLETNWDVIEKQVEKTDKDAYIYIEKTLYPLIAEAKKEKPNVGNMSALIKQTTERIANFKEKVSRL